MTISKTSSTGYRWLCCALLLFLLQTLPYLTHRWVTDESWYAGPAYSLAHGGGILDPGMGPNEQEHHFDARPPANFFLMGAFFKLFGTGPGVARLDSVLAGLAIVLMVFLLARDYMGEGPALLAAFVVATDNLIVLTSRSARPEALVVMCALASLLAMKRYADKASYAWAALSGLLMALAAMFHVTMLGWAIAVGLLAIVIDRRRGKFGLSGAALFSVAFLAGLAPYVIWIVTAPVRIAGFREEFVGKARGSSLATKFVREGNRYSDVLGFNVLHVHGLAAFPVRLPIPLFFLLCTLVLWKYRRNWFYLELLLLTPTMLWLTYSENKSSRYIALMAPVFALVIAGAVSALRGRPKLQRWLTAAAVLVIAAQVGANLVLLHGARQANYPRLAAELRSVVPPDQTAYGTMTFWLAFHGTPYVAYERTDPVMAVNDFHARYFILGDPMMSKGSAWDMAYYDDLNAKLDAIAARSDLVGEFPDPYYGDIRVYRLKQ